MEVLLAELDALGVLVANEGVSITAKSNLVSILDEILIYQGQCEHTTSNHPGILMPPFLSKYVSALL